MTRIHEADFCATVASYAEAIFRSHPEYPFKTARIEGFGRGSQKLKRKDLRFLDETNNVLLCGEVKLPGTPEGRSPYAEELVRDAHQKADDAGVQFFFTWNVNLFVLWDRKRWDVPLLDRRVREWRLGLELDSPDDAGRIDVLNLLQRKFLPDLFADLTDICTGRRPDWQMPPDDIFIRSMESHLEWPIALTRNWLWIEAEKNKAFDNRLQEWMSQQDWTFVRNDQQEWHKALHRASSTLAYLLMNRIIFYKTLYDKFGDLPQLQLRPSAKTPAEAYRNLQALFEKAVRRSGDYEPLFYPHERDWASSLSFSAPGAIQVWRGVLRAIQGIDFQRLPSDVLGRIFQRLIGPEERHKYGQHFTGDDVVDLINSFAIRTADATVIDPACGSGSFLVRAYYRKAVLDDSKTHLDLLSEIFGSDISAYPAHLATLNLAAREINEEANYPRVTRRDFLYYAPGKEFCRLPRPGGAGEVSIPLPRLDAVVTNPPYVRQEKIEKKDKDHAKETLEKAWPGLQINGRSDLHCYFWPAAARLLNEDGYLGFLTSSSWLDVEYGFQLQSWILQNFQILAIMESNAEPWFPDARVKTCITILRRCSDNTARLNNTVRFVQFRLPLSQIIGQSPADGETQRQRALEVLRDEIESTSADYSDNRWRVIVKRQSELWNSGVRAASTLAGTSSLLAASDGDEESDEDHAESQEGQLQVSDQYAAGKWGRFVRAPNVYFDIMREFGDQFTALGELASIRFGVKSGCDAFFMPREITAEALQRFQNNAEFKKEFGVDRSRVSDKHLQIIKAGDGSAHLIEPRFLKPEVHTLRKVYRPIVERDGQSRFVLMVNEPLSKLGGTYVKRYLSYGETHPFASKKSKSVPVPKRPTCASRETWYDLTSQARESFALWPKATQYGHIAPYNPDSVIANCRLYYLSRKEGSSEAVDELQLTAILNSTIVGFWRSFYGRYTGTEGSLDTEIVDVNLIEVPRPLASGRLRQRLIEAFEEMQERDIGPFIEAALLKCDSAEIALKIASSPLILPAEFKQSDRQQLDDAVLELIGVQDSGRRRKIMDQLYSEAALYFRSIRVVELQKMEQRRASAPRAFSAEELAQDLWDAAELPDLTPVREWIAKQPGTTAAVIIPNASPAYLPAHARIFDDATIYFGKDRKDHIICSSREQAELVKALADLGVSGAIHVPPDPSQCTSLNAALQTRITNAKSHFGELALSRTGLEAKQEEVADLLLRWFTLGRSEHSEN